MSPEQGNGAEAVARYFATTDRPGSTHLVADNNSVIRCVEDADTAFGAAGANSDGLHIELVGQADQTAAQWRDEYSRAELAQAAPYIRAWADKYRIPLRWLSVAEVANGTAKGLCTHKDVSDAFPNVSTGHWDPGPNFDKQLALDIWEDDIVTDADKKEIAELVLAEVKKWWEGPNPSDAVRNPPGPVVRDTYDEVNKTAKHLDVPGHD